MKRYNVILILLFTLPLLGVAQELRCNVQVNSDQIEGSSKEIFNTLRQSISDYVNNQRWTNMSFFESERIECNMTIIINSANANVFSGEIQIQSRRPVFGTSYTSPVLNLRDPNFTFKYQQYDKLEYQQNTFSTNLTAMLAYYCHLIIGYDCDTYSKLGGTPYFQACEDIVNMCQSASMEDSELVGWKAFESNRNRYAIINNLMDEAFKKYRLFLYDYHRLGLDEMSKNVGNGRARIASGMSTLREANKARPATHVIAMFADAKADELVNIFSKGTEEEKNAAYDVLTAVDPTRISTYDKIKQ